MRLAASGRRFLALSLQRRYAALPPADFYSKLQSVGIQKFFGVPDSLLKDICAYITDTAGSANVCTANEGSAIAMAAGHHLATGETACVYLQNSGFGNCVNPLLSLTHEKVYRIPILLLVGWRGEPGVKDEPQHVAQGALQEELLRAAEVPYSVLPDTLEEMGAVVDKAKEHLQTKGSPYCLLVRKGAFQKYKLKADPSAPTFEMGREDAIKVILDSLGERDCVVSTTGMPSREVFEHRAATGGVHKRDFLTVGCMGHASQIAVGIALAQPQRSTYVLDGDGATIMHMGGLATIGGMAQSAEGTLSNLKHIVINNGAHDSVGGQPTVGFDVAFPTIAKGCGYKTILPTADTRDALSKALKELASAPGPAVLEVRVNKGARSDLGRPTTTPIENKEAMMAFLQA